MLCASAVCPHPPLLVPEVAAGAAPELDELRGACVEALEAGLATGPDRVVLVGAGDRTGPVDLGGPDVGGRGALAGFGLPAVGAVGELPLSLTIGAWLLDQVGWVGPRVAFAVAAGEEPHACAAAGARLACDGRTFLLALGDGSARRSVAAPGHFDARAEAFDAGVAAALASGDFEALLALDRELAADLLAAGRSAWQVFAGAARSGPQVTARVLYDDAPYGVGYLVAAWTTAAWA